MTHVDCPHCGARNGDRFAPVDRCRECGRSLPAESELAAFHARVLLARRALGKLGVAARSAARPLTPRRSPSQRSADTD